MGHIDPALLTQLITAAVALLTGLSTLAVALAGYFKSRSNAVKLDENTKMTTEIHAVTNGPLAAMGQNVVDLKTQASTNAAAAVATAEAAKIQAATDAKASKD
jgi:hypothetical protein